MLRNKSKPLCQRSPAVHPSIQYCTINSLQHSPPTARSYLVASNWLY